MTTLEDQISELLKAAPGEPPMSLDADELLDVHALRRGRLLAPLLVAAAVVAVAVAVAIATRTAGPSRSLPSGPAEQVMGRPAWSYAQGTVTAVDVTVVRKSLDPAIVSPRPIRRTLTGAAAQQLAALFNSLPTRRVYTGSCPLTSNGSDTLLFHSDQRIVKVDVSLGCGDQTVVSEPRRQRDPVYVAGTDIDHALLRALGLPQHYGFTAERHHAEPVSRGAAEAFARRAISAPESAPTFSRLMSAARFESIHHERVPALSGAREVWVVTVHAPATDDGGPGRPPRNHDVYSVVVNAVSGLGTDDCAGCDWVKYDQ